MPTPFSPNPVDPSSKRNKDVGKAPSTQNGSDTNEQTTSLVAKGSGSEPRELTPEPPTVISATRPLRTFDQLMISDSLAGRKLGHFELIEAVGAGGMAAVLKARDLDLGRIVALKILPPDMATEPENIVRFKQEARAAAKLDHDNVARVYFIGEDQGLHFIAFEFVEGDNLRQLMDANGGTIAVADAVSIMMQVTVGLGHAAERGVVHRDIKPSNIIVTPDGRAKIVDMGLARSLDLRLSDQITETGVTLGTFDYVSPEQAIDPHLADVRSDLYSLGCTFYHALTGRPPVPEGTAAKKLDAQKNIVPADPRGFNADIPAELAHILARMMAKDPDRRYQKPDHLASHLRSLAKKLGVSSSLVPTPPTLPAPTRSPRRLSLAWGLTAIAIALMTVALLSNVFQKDPPVVVPDDKGNGGDPVDPGGTPVVIAGPKDAGNTAEFLALLRQGVKHIRLTGPEYDLVKFRGDDGHYVDAVLSGDDVRIEGIDSPTFVVNHVAPDAKARMRTLTVRGSGASGAKATIKGVRFVLPDREGNVGDAGLFIGGFDRIAIEECTFATTGQRTIQKGPAALGISISGGSVTVNRCYFAPGCVGIEIDGPGKLTLTECAIAPQHTGIQVTRSASESTGETELQFNHCSALMTAVGAIVEVEDSVPCIVRAGHSLFAGPDRSSFDDAPVVLRQRKNRAATTRYNGDGESRPNAYFHISAYADGEATYTFAEAAREKLPINDVERPMKYPWKDRDPYALLATQPPDTLTALTPNIRLAELRVKDDPMRPMVGTRFLGKDPLYQVPLRSIDSEARDLTVKVWDPSLADMADDLPPGVFATQAQALAAIRSGDTLLIRHTGRLEVDPHEFTRKDTNLIIKPDSGYKPVLVPAASVLKRAGALFKLYGGKLVLDGLHFRLLSDPERAPAIALLPGGGQLELRNTVVTLEDGEDLAAITLIDPRGEMMMGTTSTKPDAWPVPRLTIENAFVRGKGKLLDVKGSRPFELDIKNVLAALDGTMIEIEPSTADPSSAGSGVIRMTRLTAYLGGCLLHMRASDRKSDNGATGLARTEMTTNGCVFTRAGQSSEPLVRADRIDSREQLERWLSWRGKHNVYDIEKKKTMLELRPSDVEASSIKQFDGDRWMEITLEAMDPDPFADVIFKHRLPDAGQPRKFLGIKPSDFEGTRIDPPRESASEIGASADVPSLFADE